MLAGAGVHDLVPMVRIEGGDFEVGADDGQPNDDEGPSRTVRIGSRAPTGQVPLLMPRLSSVATRR